MNILKVVKFTRFSREIIERQIVKSKEKEKILNRQQNIANLETKRHTNPKKRGNVS
jgi:hypothetical protein